MNSSDAHDSVSVLPLMKPSFNDLAFAKPVVRWNVVTRTGCGHPMAAPYVFPGEAVDFTDLLKVFAGRSKSSSRALSVNHPPAK